MNAIETMALSASRWSFESGGGGETGRQNFCPCAILHRGSSGNRVDEFIKFIEEELAQRSVNALILRFDYGFQFTSRPEMADKNGLSREQAQKIAEACKKHQIRIIPLVNLLGHQSWQSNCGKICFASTRSSTRPPR